MTSGTDRKMMRRALALAERGRGSTSPNPPVGAVIVSGGRVVGEGWHRRAGEAHAEIEALTAAGEAARGATMYVTLEPCTVHGRTPPCAPAVAAAGIARVVIGTTDPNPRVDGQGIRELAAAGVAVDAGILDLEARRMIQAFAKHVRTGRSFVTAKIALTLDGRAAAADGSSQWITGPTARRDAHRLRGSVDAVVAGIGTVLKDDPQLTVRLRGFKGSPPVRVIIDSAARTPLRARALAGGAPTLIVVTDKADDHAVAALRERGADVWRAPSRDGRVDLAATLDQLGSRGLMEVMIEGGPALLGDAVERELVDRYVFYLAPKLLGSSGLAAIAGFVSPTIAEARELVVHSVRHAGADLRVEAYPRP